MKRQSPFYDQVKGFNLKTYTDLLNQDLKGFIEYISPFAERKVTITEAELGIERQLLHKWKRSGLIPFRSKKDTDKKSWTRFSFIELCWLKVMYVLRQQGVGIERLKTIKNNLFNIEFLKELLKSIPLKEVEKVAPSFLNSATKEGFIIDGGFKESLFSEEIAEEYQFSVFTCLLVSTMLFNGVVLLYIDDKGAPGIIDIAALKSKPIIGVDEIYNILNVPSITFVNLKAIVEELSANKEELIKKQPK
jgi:hypothetical protein